MPSKAEHRGKAEHNEFFVSDTGNPFFDWAVCGTFYAALHYVDAYLATHNIHPHSHAIRISHIQRDSRLNAIYVDYRELLNESRDARYEPTITFVQADVNRVQHSLEAIKRIILPLIP